MPAASTRQRFADALGRDLTAEEQKEVGVSLFLFRDPDTNSPALGTLQQANAVQEAQDEMKDIPPNRSDPTYEHTLFPDSNGNRPVRDDSG